MLKKTKIDQYCHNRTSNPPVLLNTLEHKTNTEMHLPQMLCGKLEGRFLKMLTQLVNAKYVLEVGMYTGYSALSIAEGMSVDGKLITLDVDERVEQFARSFFDKSPHGHKIEIKMGPALDTIKTLKDKFMNSGCKLDLVFIDADKRGYPDYFSNILPMVRSGGLIVVDNTLLDGKVLDANNSSRGKMMDEFNQLVLNTKEVETVMLPIRDGVTLIRKK